MPVVLAVTVGVFIDMFVPLVPIVPLPLVNATDVVPVTVPPVCVIVPEPEAVRVTVAAETLAPSDKAPAVVRANVPPAAEAPPIVVLPLL